jgi:hypothetical protein
MEQLVEIYKLQNDGTQTVIVTAQLSGSEVTFEGDPELIKSLASGIIDYETRGSLLPTAGLRYLQQLQYNFRSGYLNASAVIEKIN